MGLSTEQTVAVIDAVGEVIHNQNEPQGWLMPLAITIIGGIVTTIFGVWYSKKRKTR